MLELKTSKYLRYKAYLILRDFHELEYVDNVLTNQQEQVSADVVEKALVQSNVLKLYLSDAHVAFNIISLDLGNPYVFYDDLFDVCQTLMRKPIG